MTYTELAEFYSSTVAIWGTVTGTVEARAWLDGRSGEPRASLEVTAGTVRFLGGPDERSRPTGALPNGNKQPVPDIDMAEVDAIPF